MAMVTKGDKKILAAFERALVDHLQMGKVADVAVSDASNSFAGLREDITRLVYRSKAGRGIVRKHVPFTTYEVQNLDVWGNRQDGWEINQAFTAGTTELPWNFDAADVCSALKKSGHLNDSVRSRQIELDDPSSMGTDVTVLEKKSGKPVYTLVVRER
jgi:hypothetical protein